jgi:hypothetical protein
MQLVASSCKKALLPFSGLHPREGETNGGIAIRRGGRPFSTPRHANYQCHDNDFHAHVSIVEQHYDN